MKKFLKTRWGLVVLVLIVIGLFIFFQKLQLFAVGENLITGALKPIQLVLFQASERLKGLFSYFGDVKQLAADNDELERKVSQLTEENLKLRRDLENSEILKQELSYSAATGYQSVVTRVIGVETVGNSRILILNKGSATGLQHGYAVMVGDGILVGKVVDTTSQIAKIRLLNDSQSEVSATIQNDAKTPGIVAGQYNLSLKMELIPQDQTIAVNQLVTTSGLEEFIPPDMLIGKVATVTKREGELFQAATIEPATSYQNISIVSVILPSRD